MKKVLTLLLLIALFLTSSSAFAIGSNAKKKYDGETIFRGIIFGQGEVAKHLPDIWTNDLLSKANDPQAVAAANSVVLNIKQNNPAYFNELEKSVYSGDHLKIRAALKEGGHLSLQSSQSKGLGSGLGAVIVAPKVTLLVYERYAVVHDIHVTAATSQENSLEQDRLVESIVKAL
ncbi:sporulation delaying protein family toxin [Paenibacillus elgii]|uniref:sporulation delaying protein family toxin n=1 Tax=Paenibacillus elgii TaxID=189691 RepID=UPI00204250E4|nr:sporulation delaying protein family toxin [Paenibacillus elgii]MCM3269765.1 sporulation delaying protein family toxin [Paenibacillus elgii]